MNYKMYLAAVCCLSTILSSKPVSAQDLSPIFSRFPRMSAIDQNTSANWAGYVSTKGGFTSITGTWQVPQLAANGKTGFDSAWVGIGGVYSNDLIQSGTAEQINSKGQTIYNAWIEMLPAPAQNIPLEINAGDSITTTISKQAGNKWKITMTDQTSGQDFSTIADYKSSLSSAEWIEEIPSDSSGLLPLDNFGSVRFSAGSAVQNCKPENIGKIGAKPISIANRRGRNILAAPSSLQDDGSAFTVNQR